MRPKGFPIEPRERHRLSRVEATATVSRDARFRTATARAVNAYVPARFRFGSLDPQRWATRGMSIRGVWQLLRLNVNYCDHSGSSKHIRAFVNSSLTEYAAQYPHAEVTSTVRRGKHPHMTGEFRNGNTKTVDLRNMEEEQIKFHLRYMFSEKGKRGGGPVKNGRRFTVNKSVQGMWRPGMWDAANGAAAAGSS